ncbi:hypothetical protein AB9K28_11685 [Enterobacter asburiae]
MTGADLALEIEDVQVVGTVNARIRRSRRALSDRRRAERFIAFAGQDTTPMLSS